jgi:hypothetical protein
MAMAAFAVLTTAAAVVLVLLFWKHFLLLAGDRGGLCLEAGLLGMVTGWMLLSLGEYQLVPFVVMISLAAFFMGYVRLHRLLRDTDSN